MHKKQQGDVLLFDRHKYTWLIIGLVVTALGFLLMIGGGSEDPATFNDAIFNFRRLTLAPLLVMAGYGMQIYAILKKTTILSDKEKEKEKRETPTRSKPAKKK